MTRETIESVLINPMATQNKAGLLLNIFEVDRKKYAKEMSKIAIEKAIGLLIEDDIIYNPNDFLPQELNEVAK